MQLHPCPTLGHTLALTGVLLCSSGFGFVGCLLLEERAFYPVSPVDSLIHLFPVSSPLTIAARTQMTTAL